jgi:hypothetical protein
MLEWKFVPILNEKDKIARYLSIQSDVSEL